jgi:LmbE family N-acetylglucosaminyl deacetylase
MNNKFFLQQLQRFVPNILLNKLQELHSNLLFHWILRGRSQPLAVNQKSAIVFSPHQDDETLGCGGIIALKREHGVPVRVVFLTDGQNSGDPRIKPDEIIQIRKQEAMTALRILGVEPSEIHFLGQPDGALGQLLTEQRQDTIEQLTQLLQLYKPEEAYVPHRKDCHRDHEATYELVQEAIAKSGLQVELLQYPIWLLWRAPLFIILKLQDIAVAYRLSIDSVQDKKKGAIEAYSSQIVRLSPAFLNHFLGSYEIFFKVESE